MTVRSLLAILLVLVGACSTAPDAEEGAGHLIITGADGSVETVDVTTGERVVLSPGEGADIPVQATSSLDGATLVWSDVTGEGDQIVRVHDDAGPRSIDVPAWPFYYAFNAGGSTVAALANDPAGAGVALLLIDLEENSSRLVEVGQPYFVDWSPDGAELAAHVGADVLGVVDADGERTNLEVSPGLFSAPAWTDDGRIVAVLAPDQLTVSQATLQVPRFELAVVDPGDSATERIADLAEAAAFEVAGDRIAYIHADSGLGPLVVDSVAGGDPVEVAPDEVVMMEWSPDGERLLFHTLVGDSLELVPHVWDGEAVTDFPGFVPTGLFVTQYLPFWAQYTRTITQWSPDSQSFAYVTAGAGGEAGQVWVQPLDGARHGWGQGEMVIWTP